MFRLLLLNHIADCQRFPWALYGALPHASDLSHRVVTTGFCAIGERLFACRCACGRVES
jgi:hypothetical protein